MTDLKEKKIAVVGLGLIGGSIARGLRLASPAQTILAADTNAESLRLAHDEGTIDDHGELAEVCAKADLIVLALPPLAVAEVIPTVASVVANDAIVTDVASVKSHIRKSLEPFEDLQRNFVPGHPIAGSEQSGYAAASADLFKNRKVILTPMSTTATEHVAVVNELWRLLGAEVLGMTIERHDEVLAATSHLPHLLAFAIVDVLLGQEESEDIFRYAAGGFADFSRLASSDARMWSDIFVANATATSQILDAYIDNLKAMRQTLVRGDHDHLMKTFSRAKQARDNFVQRHFNVKNESDAEDKQMDFLVEPGGHVSGQIRVPGDKSISHRSIILGSIAEGVTTISGFLEGEDALNTVAAFREMGVTIVGPENGRVTIYGVGKNGLKAPRRPLYMGNSGTAMRLLAGLLAAQDFDSVLEGDESLAQRPMLRVAEPLREMGAQIATDHGGTPPLKITGGPLHGIRYDMKIASAQVKSCLLLAGLYAEGKTTVTEPAVCRDHTERMLGGFGYPLQRSDDGTVILTGGEQLHATEIDVPADISSAAFFLVAAAITPGSELLLQHVGVNPTRIGIINLLRAMGAEIDVINKKEVGGEPVADLLVKHAPLKGIIVPEDQIPLAIDEFPVLFIAAACAEGETVLRGAEELRVKESDRIDAMARGLETLGVEIETYEDGIRIVGGDIEGGDIDSRGDHRIAMSFAVAALHAKAPIRIHDCANVGTSFPGFTEIAQDAGIRITEYIA